MHGQLLKLIIFYLLYTALSASPETLHMSNVDFVSRQLTFSWSRVSTDCVAMIHYNILASNCGSCPNTTNHTSVTCTDVPTNGTTCMFAIQTVFCGYITGNVSDPIIINTTFHHNNNIMCTDSLSTDTAYIIISTGLLATALIACIAVFLTVMIIMSIRNRARNKAATELHVIKRGARTTQADSMYEDVMTPSLPVGAISTKDNVAYSHTYKNDCS